MLLQADSDRICLLISEVKDSIKTPITRRIFDVDNILFLRDHSWLKDIRALIISLGSQFSIHLLEYIINVFHSVVKARFPREIISLDAEYSTCRSTNER